MRKEGKEEASNSDGRTGVPRNDHNRTPFAEFTLIFFVEIRR